MLPVENMPLTISALHYVQHIPWQEMIDSMELQQTE